MAMSISGCVFCTFAGIHHYYNRSLLTDKLSRKDEIRLPFLDNLWIASGLSRQDEMKYGLIMAAGGTLAGAMLGNYITGAVFGILGFLFGPILAGKWVKEHFRRQFMRQYVRTLFRLKNALTVNPVAVALVNMVNISPEPSNRVFQFISDSIQNNQMPDAAIRSAAKEFGIPELDALADTIHNINEVGGGPQALLSLDVLRKNIVKSFQFSQEVESGTLENKLTVIVCSAIIAGLTYMSYSDKGGMSQLVAEYSTPIWIGGIILALGIFITFAVIERAKRTM